MTANCIVFLSLILNWVSLSFAREPNCQQVLVLQNPGHDSKEIHHLIPNWAQLALSNLPRRGWVQRAVPEQLQESVWQHTLKLQTAVYLFVSKALPDHTHEAMLMALVHDLAEAIVGDFTPADNIDKAAKYRLEYQAMLEIISTLPHGESRRALELWYQYEHRLSPLASFVKDLDKIDAAVQAMVLWQKGQKTLDLILATHRVLKTPELQKLYVNLAHDFQLGLLRDPYKDYFKRLTDLTIVRLDSSEDPSDTPNPEDPLL